MTVYLPEKTIANQTLILSLALQDFSVFRESYSASKHFLGGARGEGPL